MSSFDEYVKIYAELADRARNMAKGHEMDSFGTTHPHICTFEKCALPEPFSNMNKKILLFSPHPDDECIVGLLPLRLMVECGFKVKNIAVTLGSDKRRRLERLKELEGACSFLTWDLFVCGTDGFESMNEAFRESSPDIWASYVSQACNIIKEEMPAAIFMPHFKDSNKTHKGTFLLVQDALARLGEFEGLVIETEYWGAMETPNIMAEASVSLLGMQISALSFHVGEIARNDYHVRLPAWMSDNVRRGGELVGGQGATAPLYPFATLYRSNVFKDGRLRPIAKKMFLSQNIPAGDIFKF